MTKRNWQLQDAKNRFCQVAEEAAAYGPQMVTKHGRPAVVVLSVTDYDRLRRPRTGLVDFLLNSPLAGVALPAVRAKDSGREVKL